MYELTIILVFKEAFKIIVVWSCECFIHIIMDFTIDLIYPIFYLEFLNFLTMYFQVLFRQWGLVAALNCHLNDYLIYADVCECSFCLVLFTLV